MLRFLPTGRRAQDLTVVAIGCAIFIVIVKLLLELGLSDFVAVGVGLGGIAVLTGESEARNIIAGMKFGQAKKQSQQ